MANLNNYKLLNFKKMRFKTKFVTTFKKIIQESKCHSDLPPMLAISEST